MPSFAHALVSAANAEHQRFGGRHETDPAVRPLLAEYWIEGAGLSRSRADQMIDRREAWSAAFISFVVRRALAASGSRARFVFSASHSVYAGHAILNDFNNVPAPAFHGLPPNGAGAEKPKPGDLLGYTRVAAVGGYEDALRAARAPRGPETYFSHFDVVTASAGGQLTVVGGNVSDTLKAEKVKLDADGFPPRRPFKFSSVGRVVSGPYICLIRHMDG
ncbi:DUF2272 domain-containing protein [Falsiroseomonas oryzae]|uniref:DUF2272 domain-containing protein n=1 Tax=Falsiroseomonas oryzae TaxID=2766473 RepID=UPI0022EB692E|nr:DUF2272 domain-containing protein [Roseomonas sp. MO-31]